MLTLDGKVLLEPYGTNQLSGAAGGVTEASNPTGIPLNIIMKEDHEELYVIISPSNRKIFREA